MKKHQYTEKQQKLHRLSWAVRIATVAAFVGVAGLATFTAFQANRSIENSVIADATGSPKAWQSLTSGNIIVNSLLSSELYDHKYLQFTAQVSNANSTASAYITHLAAYQSTDGTDADGFIPLSDASLKYTYTPDDDGSWRPLSLSQPDDQVAFRLQDELRLGTAGSQTDTVYFRYYVVPQDGDTATVNDKISVLLRNDAYEISQATSAATVAYQSASSSTEIAASDDSADPDAAASTHANPLGRSSFVPETEPLTTTIASLSLSSDQFLTIGVIAMVIAVAIFVACLVIYLPLKKY